MLLFFALMQRNTWLSISSEVYLGPYLASMMELFTKELVND